MRVEKCIFINKPKTFNRAN